MKAVIVELKNGYAAALTDDGCIKKLQNKDYAIGQVIEMKAHKSKKIAVWAASAAAAVLLCSTTVWAYVSPYTYVSLDVNPSIEFSVNRFGRVLSAKAVNGDGAEILQTLKLKNKSIEDAVRATVKQIEQAGYFSGEEPGGVVVATSSPDQNAADNLADEIKDAVIETTQDAENDVEVESTSVGYERVQQAKELGVTPGKLNLVEKLKAASQNPDSIDINEWLKKPVKDIMKATKEYRKSQKNGDDVPVPGSSEPATPGSSGVVTPGSSEPAVPGNGDANVNREQNKEKNKDAYNKEQNREKNDSSKVSSISNKPTQAVSSDSSRTRGNGNNDEAAGGAAGNDDNTGGSGGSGNGNSGNAGGNGNAGNAGGSGNAGGKGR
ncbi:anti-sigma-I factor RsgI family protein [Acetanaerobacterium elongatum]|uniref:RsgI N-terminal anti-sigma domain-containing protein n=1 Tax=Acetanaerobacterium elongatum TaxID=258515 RepID=A0A1G9UL93_9FIRM|nr:hypothetical protein [Acetanaerobacterium elongatum]SDM60604.1 hypothetical protein SAMN05192585_10248 [Acetanaerobacterium elongatum]